MTKHEELDVWCTPPEYQANVDAALSPAQQAVLRMHGYSVYMCDPTGIRVRDRSTGSLEALYSDEHEAWATNKHFDGQRTADDVVAELIGVHTDG